MQTEILARRLRRGDRIVALNGVTVEVEAIDEVDGWIEIATVDGQVFFAPGKQPFEVDRREWPEYGWREEAREAVGGELW